ncbi:hypothetical protein [Methylobacter sp.]|uniref:hypothetical protein n=1 Tax=Methylobacter sp. TaxID=2051955 RepID=UPI002FDCF53B
MTLWALIQKNGLRQLATLTVATPATLKTPEIGTVATVATVNVANPEIQKGIIAETTDNRPIVSSPEQVSDDEFFKDDRRYCSECSHLSVGRCLAAWRGEIEAGRQYRPIDDIPRRCEGYAPMLKNKGRTVEHQSDTKSST